MTSPSVAAPGPVLLPARSLQIQTAVATLRHCGIAHSDKARLRLHIEIEPGSNAGSTPVREA